jgi:hypothetical protein
MQVADALPCRRVIRSGQGAHHRSIWSFQYQSHQRLILYLRRGTGNWLFLVNDAGELTAALHAIAPDDSHALTWHTLTPSEAQPIVTAEEAFWLRWVVDWPLS